MIWDRTEAVKKRRERCLKLGEWHPWFAWYPVRVVILNFEFDGWVWLHEIQRRRSRLLSRFKWEYTLRKA